MDVSGIAALIARMGQKASNSNEKYWLPKLARNAARDKEAQARLRGMRWKVRVVWECQTRDASKLHRMAQVIKKIKPTQRQ